MGSLLSNLDFTATDERGEREQAALGLAALAAERAKELCALLTRLCVFCPRMQICSLNCLAKRRFSLRVWYGAFDFACLLFCAV